MENTNKTNWEVHFISSKQILYTEHGVFHYELVLNGMQIPNKHSSVGQSMSHIKFCPVMVEYKGCLYKFFVNSVNKTAVCQSDQNIVIPWKEGKFINPVINLVELTPDEQLTKHKVLLENYIEEEYIPEIFKLLSETEFR